MDCRDVQPLLHPYSDGELDLVRHLQVEHHLAECTACADRERELRQLRGMFAETPLYHRAPDSLREKVLAALDTQATPAPTTPAPAARKRRPWAAFAATAAGIVLAFAAGLAAVGVWEPSDADYRLAEQVAAGHVRSLQADHLTDQPSSDRHVVKPWFQDKLSFSPQVPDLAADGFPLAGGRLDYITDRPVAAIVYHRSLHTINLFTWPATDDADRPVRSLHRQGFHLRQWQHAGMTYWAVSDLNPQELDDFVRLYRGQADAVSP